MGRYEYKSEFARKYVAQGREEGREEGREVVRRALIDLARSKTASISPSDEARIRELADDEVLQQLLIDLGRATDAVQARAILDRLATS